MDVVRKQIQVRGIVQGVGFRPFVYRLAHRFHLHGHVRNTGDGVLMEVEGAPQPVEEFRQEWPVNTHPWLKWPKQWSRNWCQPGRPALPCSRPARSSASSHLCLRIWPLAATSTGVHGPTRPPLRVSGK